MSFFLLLLFTGFAAFCAAQNSGDGKNLIDFKISFDEQSTVAGLHIVLVLKFDLK